MTIEYCLTMAVNACRRPIAWSLRFALAVGIVVAASLGSPGIASAECGRLDSWPSFTKVAPSAELIVVGTVTEAIRTDPTGLAVWFRLRVDEVLRGEVLPDPVDGTVTLGGVRSGYPPVGCPSDSVVRANVGDVVAIASDGHMPSVEAQEAGIIPVQESGELPPDGFPRVTVAFITGEPDRFFMPQVEELSIERVRVLALPDTGMDEESVDPRTVDTRMILLGLGFASLVVIVFQRRRRLHVA